MKMLNTNLVDNIVEDPVDGTIKVMSMDEKDLADQACWVHTFRLVNKVEKNVMCTGIDSGLILVCVDKTYEHINGPLAGRRFTVETDHKYLTPQQYRELERSRSMADIIKSFTHHNKI